MSDDTGLIQQGANAGEEIAKLLTMVAQLPARELEQFLLGLDINLTGDASPIPQPLRAVVSPLLSTVIRAVALAPDAIADAAESARRVATGE